MDSAQNSRDAAQGCTSACGVQPATGQGNRRAFPLAARIRGRVKDWVLEEMMANSKVGFWRWLWAATLFAEGYPDALLKIYEVK